MIEIEETHTFTKGLTPTQLPMVEEQIEEVISFEKKKKQRYYGGLRCDENGKKIEMETVEEVEISKVKNWEEFEETKTKIVRQDFSLAILIDVWLIFYQS